MRENKQEKLADMEPEDKEKKVEIDERRKR
jgi:hypothetical protein